ncbi:cysteine hydrolase family protein [Campylobacter sp. TTU-622]|uniref:isochorismatase family protein n=1 Tax=unclassified Campylobacter TaxID=2593542 RepID=UPI001905F791|nr:MULTISPECIES: cysteine hydrolase family protein [unclassified Campylobacter]MBK1971322.1 cysteine hydrolase family protein [Campylobacter sp. TTU_617]MBK1972496.1 cysteine hydrolase family protein [Campylobacter sp. TTU-622]MBK1991070.1 cysteine hydrolase family protein [Campylobacter sp. 2018MI34]
MKKAFVLIDYQNDFITGSLGFEKALKIENKILNLLNNINFNDTDLLITFDTHDNDYLNSNEGKLLPIKHCIQNTLGWQMPKNLQKYIPKAKKIFYKNTFGSLELANFINKSTYKELYFCGLVSHICVFCNIILAFSAKPDAKLFLYQEASASFDVNLEESSYNLLKAYGIKII